MRSGSLFRAKQLWILVSAAHFAEEAQDFEVEPDEGDHDAEGAIPLHVLGSAVVYAAFDGIKVENEIEGGDADDEEAEDDADGTTAVDGEEAHSEEAQQHLQQIENHDAASGCDHSEAELLRDLDHARAISEQEHKQSAEGETHGLNGNAGIAELEHSRETAKNQALKECINRRGYGSPLFFEDGDHGEDKAANAADHQQSRNVSNVVRLNEQMPRPGRRREGADQQKAGLVHGSVQRHARGGIDCTAVTGPSEAAESLITKGWIGCF